MVATKDNEILDRSGAGTVTAANLPVVNGTDTLWAQVTCDGKTVSVKEQVGATAPTAASWAATEVCYSSAGFDTSGWQPGITVWYQCVNEVQDLMIDSWDANTNAGTPASVPSSARAGSGWTTAGRDAGVPVRNGSGWVLKQNVWGLRYIDGLCQIAVNSKPDQQSTCDQTYYAIQDANYDVLGIVNSSGTLVERYTYTAYGQRQVYYSPGTNDPGCDAPIQTSQRVQTDVGTMPYGLCSFGHQGLMHDEATGLVYNRSRYLNPELGRFMSEDPLGYVDGASLYGYEREEIDQLDPLGTAMAPPIAHKIRLPWYITHPVIGNLLQWPKWCNDDYYAAKQAAKKCEPCDSCEVLQAKWIGRQQRILWLEVAAERAKALGLTLDHSVELQNNKNGAARCKALMEEKGCNVPEMPTLPADVPIAVPKPEPTLWQNTKRWFGRTWGNYGPPSWDFPVPTGDPYIISPGGEARDPVFLGVVEG